MTSWRPDISCACSRFVDIFSRFSPLLAPRFTFRGGDVVAILERACKEVGFPATIRVDQGSEFVSHDLDLWAYQRGVTLDFSRPGKPTDTDVVDKPYVAEALLCRDRGFARHRDVNLVYSFSADSTRARSSALFAGML
ncbi:transposase InsO family protein [Bradyrhizobium yuanmingense]|uniref:Transposase InsO family protein n=1 Tax=Bradyrhizobium yuanmingense TaxID=108015 RepID=A0ABV4G7M0_9BRAD